MNLYLYYSGVVVHLSITILLFKGLSIYISGSLLYNELEVIKLATNKPRYTVSVDEEMFQAIENFRFENRFQTRSEATVELIRLGLEALEEQKNKDNCSKTK